MSQSSRRALLTGAAGAVVVAASGTIARPLNVLAAVEPVNLGTTNGTSSTPITEITNGNNSAGALKLHSGGPVLQIDGDQSAIVAVMPETGIVSIAHFQGSPTSPIGFGVYGSYHGQSGSRPNGASGLASPAEAGVWGDSLDRVGVAGTSYGTTGVAGWGTTGVTGLANRNDGVGVSGFAVAGTGVYGFVFDQSVTFSPVTPANVGVRGISPNDSASLGVYGTSSTGAGVKGDAEHGVGVLGDSAHGIGGMFTSPTTTGTALRVEGKVSFDRGRKSTVPKNQKQVVVHAIDLTSTSYVIATLQASVAGVYVAAAVPNVSAKTVTLILNKVVTKAVAIGWLVLN